MQQAAMVGCVLTRVKSEQKLKVNNSKWMCSQRRSPHKGKIEMLGEEAGLHLASVSGLFSFLLSPYK